MSKVVLIICSVVALLFGVVESFNEDQHYKDRIDEFVRRKNLGYDTTTTTTTTMSYKDETTTESIGTKMNFTSIGSSFIETTENSNEPHHQKCTPIGESCSISSENCCDGHKCTNFEKLPKNMGFCYLLPKHDVINPFAKLTEKLAFTIATFFKNFDTTFTIIFKS